MKYPLFSFALLGVAAAVLPAAPALACQGPQFESALVLFHDTKQSEIPEGMVQFRVRITDRSLRDVYKRDLIRAWTIPDDAPKVGKYRKADGQLQIVKPIGTSCDSVSMPKPGTYYVTGTLAKGADGKPLAINGGNLFYPKFTRKKAYPFEIPEGEGTD